MARNQTFHPRHRDGNHPRDSGPAYGNEDSWRSRHARNDSFSAMDRENALRGESAWGEDRYGREMNRSRGDYAPEGRFAYDPYEQQQRSFEFNRGGQGWGRAQFGSGHYPRDLQRDFQQGYFQELSGRMQNPGGWSGQRDAWQGQPQHNWTEEITPYSGWRDQPSSSPHQGAAPRKTSKGYTRSDERIRDDVCEHLYRSHDVEVGDVSVDVKDGTITLEGSVPERHMKYRIEDISERCIGVTDVDNRIRISRGEAHQPANAAGSGESDGNTRKGLSARH